MTIIAVVLIIAFMVVILRTKPAVADVTITAIRYTLDDVTWIGLDGATLELGYIKVAVTWKNNSSEPVDTLMTLVVEDQGQEPDQERVTVAPNEEVTSALVMEFFIEGERRVTATIYKEDDMAKLASKTVTVSVVSVAPPPVGTILDVLIEINGVWREPTGLELNVGQIAAVGVFWQSDMATGDPNVIGNVELKVTDPTGSVTSPTAVSGNNQQLGPGGRSGPVKFNVNFNKAGSWSLMGSGDVNLV